MELMASAVSPHCCPCLYCTLVPPLQGSCSHGCGEETRITPSLDPYNPIGVRLVTVEIP